MDVDEVTWGYVRRHQGDEDLSTLFQEVLTIMTDMVALFSEDEDAEVSKYGSP